MIRKLLSKEGFEKNVLILASGTILGQIIIISSTPLLTRIYKPEDFGLLAVFIAILGITSIIASLRYELAIPIPETDKEAANIFVLSFWIVIILALITAIGIYFWAENIGILLNLPQLSAYLWLLPIGVLLTGFYNIGNYWAIRTKTFKAIAKTKVTQAIATVAVQIGAFKLGAPMLLVGHVTGQSAGVSSLGYYAVKKNWGLFKNVSFENLRDSAKKFKHFPLFSTWAGLLNSLGNYAPHILLATLFSPAAAGYYFMAQKIMALPMNLLGRAVGQAFYAEAAESNRNGNLHTLAIQTLIKLSKIVILPILIVALFGKELFSFVLGNEWLKAGEIAQWITPMVLSQFITAPIGNLLALRNKQKVGAYLQALLALFRFISILIGFHYNSFNLAIILLSISSTIGYLLFLYFSLLYSR